MCRNSIRAHRTQVFAIQSPSTAAAASTRVQATQEHHWYSQECGQEDVCSRFGCIRFVAAQCSSHRLTDNKASPQGVSSGQRSIGNVVFTSPATAVFRALAALAVGLLGAAPLSLLADPLEGIARVDGASGALLSGGHRCEAGQDDSACSMLLLLDYMECTAEGSLG